MNDTDVNDRLARIETKLDAFLMTTNDQEARLRKLEARQSALFGGGGIVAAGLALAIALIETGAM